MAQFTQAELELILGIAKAKGRDGNPFSFKGLSEKLESNGRTKTEMQVYARELGGRIKASVEDHSDLQLNFRITHYYPDGKAMETSSGSISYTLT
ncbi:hypothetical protein [Loktanella sp. M215]|uniref:hypothetical protein n=1 Tax=Loktanella sp. M215 TaxID=2675431 RepID=UPI001F1CF4A8|nr:hypothetical protein [Loktanella sp. M215]MCF7699220.1 hypothetical protein [Loktanella sp. M215]